MQTHPSYLGPAQRDAATKLGGQAPPTAHIDVGRVMGHIVSRLAPFHAWINTVLSRRTRWLTSPNLNIRSLLLSLVAAALVPLIAVLVFGIAAIAESDIERAEERADLLARDVGQNLERYFADAERVLKHVASRDAVKAMDPGRCDPLIEQGAMLYAEFTNIATRSLEGKSICSFLPSYAQLPALDSEWFRRAATADRFAVTGVLPDVAGSRWSTRAIQPIANASGRTIGFVTARIDLEMLQNRVARGLPTGTLVSVLDADGRFLMRTLDREKWVGQPGQAGVFDELTRRGNGKLRIKGVDGAARLISFHHIEALNWVVAAGVPEDEVMVPFMRNLMRAVAIALGAIAVALLVARRVSLTVVRAVHHLEGVAVRVARGERSARAVPTGPSELVVVGQEINRMLDATDRAQEHVEEARRRAQRLNDYYAALSRTNSAIVRMGSPASLYQEICDICVELGRAKVAYVALIQDGAVIPVACAGPGYPFLDGLALTMDGPSPSTGPIARAIRQEAPYICNDFHADPATLPYRERTRYIGTQALVALPFRRGGTVFGVLSLHVAETGFFDDALMALLIEMMSDLSFALDNHDRECARVQSEQDARDRGLRLQLAAQAGGIGFWEWDVATDRMYYSAEWKRQLGYGPDELGDAAGEWRSRVHPDDFSTVDHAIREFLDEGRSELRFEMRLRHRDGTYRWTLAHASAVRGDGGAMRVLGSQIDISSRKESEERIAYLATHDSLTGLSNRSLLHERTSQALAGARRSGRPLAVLFLGLDRFKLINDGYGQAFGDAVLREVGRLLCTLVRETDSVARPGGDRFLVLLSEQKRNMDVYLVAQKILDALDAPIVVEGHSVSVSPSIGIAVHPENGKTADALFGNAEVAMYRAKALGGATYQFFNAHMSEGVRQRVELESQLRQALPRGELHLVYQPKVDLATGAIAGAEALIRWTHPELGAVSPARFIPVAEEGGLIVPIGDWVLRTACAQNKAWQDAGLPPVKMSVNVSARQFLRQDVVRWVRETLEATGLPPEALELELTESVIAQDAEKVIETIDQLKDLGVAVSIDDFGTGYSSLSYLKRFRVDTLKIDQSFVRNLLSDANDAAITCTVIQLARSLGMSVIAEGVETAEHCDFLRRHGCDQIQGHFFSRPVASTEFEAMLKTARRLPLPPCSTSAPRNDSPASGADRT